MTDVTTPDTERHSPTPAIAIPDYAGLVKFLLQPFLELPDSLKVDCEVLPRKSRVLIRVAFDGEDRGRVYGRGGRNIQAIRIVLQGVAQATGYALHLDVFGSQPTGREPGGHESAGYGSGDRAPSGRSGEVREAQSDRRPSTPKPPPRRKASPD